MVFETLHFYLSSTSSKTSRDGGLVGSSGESPDDVAAHGYGAADGAGCRAIGGADGGAEDLNSSCIRLNKMLSFLSRNASIISI